MPRRHSPSASRPTRFRSLGAWLGLIALAAQLLGPLLFLPRGATAFAADLPFGDAAALCLADPATGPTGEDRPFGPHHSPGTFCPVCLSLSIGPSALPPEGIPLDVPSVQTAPPWHVAAADALQEQLRSAVRSRGPPPAA